MKNQFFRQLILGTVCLASSCAVFNAGAAVPIQINAYAVHYGGQVVYRYQIQNNSNSIIHAADIGVALSNKELPGKPWSLNPNWNLDDPVPFALPLAQCKPFAGMDCTVSLFQFEGMTEPKARVMMESVEKKSPFSNVEFIRPGTFSSVAELYIPLIHQSLGYLAAFGTVFLLDNNTKNPDGTVITSLEIPFTKMDTLPPTLTVTLTPAILSPANERLIPITATISVKDNYDPAPEIKLESISANEMLEAEDIREAAIGTDDRNFRLRAERKGVGRFGRIYSVTYSATDASGNKSTATASVTVPREGEEEDRPK
jgi:hypothetical protein